MLSVYKCTVAKLPRVPNVEQFAGRVNAGPIIHHLPCTHNANGIFIRNAMIRTVWHWIDSVGRSGSDGWIPCRYGYVFWQLIGLVCARGSQIRRTSHIFTYFSHLRHDVTKTTIDKTKTASRPRFLRPREGQANIMASGWWWRWGCRWWWEFVFEWAVATIHTCLGWRYSIGVPTLYLAARMKCIGTVRCILFLYLLVCL